MRELLRAHWGRPARCSGHWSCPPCHTAAPSAPSPHAGETVPEEEQVSAGAVEAMKTADPAPSKEAMTALLSAPPPMGVAEPPTTTPQSTAPSNSSSRSSSTAKQQSRLSGEGLAGWEEERQRLYTELDEKVC